MMTTLLSTTSALVSNSRLQLFDGYSEYGNLFTICLAPSATGKSPSCNLGCTVPVMGTVEKTAERTIIIDDTSVSGLFNIYAQREKEYTPLLCVDEAFPFLHSLTLAKSKGSMSMDRLCKLYDGQPWLQLKGSKGKRTGVSSARMSVLLYTTPKRFLKEVWPKIVNFGNGLSGRFQLLYSVNKNDIDFEVQENASQRVGETTIKTLDSVYEKICTEHLSGLVYTFNDESKKSFYAYIKQKAQTQQKDTEGKLRSNSLKVILNTHVLFHRLGACLNLESTATPSVINEGTLQRALTFFDALLTFSAIAELSVDLGNLKVPSPSESDIMNKVFEINGPFVSPRRVSNAFSSAIRPSTIFVCSVFAKMKTEGLGDTETIPQRGSQPVTIFFKVFPSKISNENLHKLGKSSLSYAELFKAEDKLQTNTQVTRYRLHHPKGIAALQEELDKNSTEAVIGET